MNSSRLEIIPDSQVETNQAGFQLQKAILKYQDPEDDSWVWMLTCPDGSTAVYDRVWDSKNILLHAKSEFAGSR